MSGDEESHLAQAGADAGSSPTERVAGKGLETSKPSHHSDDEPSSEVGGSQKLLPSMARTSSNNASLAGKFKIKSYGSGSEATALATFNNPWTKDDWPSQKLADLRKVLDHHVKVGYAFCMADKSIVPEDMHVVDYFEDTSSVVTPVEMLDDEKDAVHGGEETAAGKDKVPSSKPPTHNIIYLKEKEKAQVQKPAAIDALSKSFMIKFVDKSGETSTSSIQSSDLPKDKNDIQLQALRGYANMSNNQSRHEFCLDDGTSVGDSMLLKTYISKGDVPNDIDSDLPILTVYFQKVGRKSIFAEASEEMKKRGDIDTTTDLSLGAGNEKPVTNADMADKAADLSKLGFQQSFLDSLASVQSEKSLTPAELDEMQWDTVLRNCNVMYGWKFDLDTMSVKRAPHQAFKLRRGLNMVMDSVIPLPRSRVKTMASKTDQTVRVAKEEDAKSKKAGEGGSKGEEDAKKENKDSNSASPPATTAIPKRRKPDAIPSFCVADDSKVEVILASSTLQESMAKNNFTASSFEIGGSASIKGVEIGGSTGNAERKENGEGTQRRDAETLMIGNYKFPRALVFLRAEDLEPTEGLATAIENIRISKSLDQLKALHNNYGQFFCEEVLIGGRLQTTRATKSTDNYLMTRAKSQFKSQVGVAISMPKVFSFSTKHSTETGKNEEKTKQETESVDTITFEATGGDTILSTNPPLWTQSVLDHRNWRVIERSGLTPLGAVLGRCSDLQARKAQGWFAQALPYHSKYIAIPSSRTLPVRLKLNSKIPQLSHQEGQLSDRAVCYYLGHQYGKYVHPVRVGLAFRDTITESGPVVSKEAMSALYNISTDSPAGQLIRNMILPAFDAIKTDISTVYKEVDIRKVTSLFTPARVQAPVVLPYDVLPYEASNLTSVDVKNDVKNHYKQTVWNMIVPHGRWLENNSLVMLTSASAQTYHDEVWLTVYRNAQGHFMPAMTSSGDASFWRVKKETNVTEDRIREGNTIKLTWQFSDQTSGFRDFYDDSFGRRTFNKPEKVEEELYLKLPFPGFQRTIAQDEIKQESDGLAMMMSEIKSEEPFLKAIDICSETSEGSQKSTYNLHDMSFRVDLVGNAGLGELNDYMTIHLKETEFEKVADVISQLRIISQSNASLNGIDEVMDKMNQAGDELFGSGFSAIPFAAKTIISGATGLWDSIFG